MQIINTFKCNYLCKHCLYASSPRHKEFMTRDTFITAVDMFCADLVHIIGGEPFLHPDIIWQMDTVTRQFNSTLSIVTNGSWVENTNGRLFAHLYPDIDYNDDSVYDCSVEKLGIELWSELVDQKGMFINVSKDNFHSEFNTTSIDEIIRRVKLYFRNVGEYKNNGFILPMGRAKKNNLGSLYNGLGQYVGNNPADCMENFEPTILPNGDVAICCNARQIIGNVHSGMTMDDFQEIYEKTIKSFPTERKVSDCETCTKYSKLYKEN